MSSLPVAVPIHVKVDVALAEGTTDGDNEAWQTLNADYSQSAALIDYASVPRADGMQTSCASVDFPFPSRRFPSLNIYFTVIAPYANRVAREC